MRCLEQIRNDVCYHSLNVKVVAVGGGVAYGAAGYTHHAVEDLAVMNALPGMTVLAPADPVETRCAVQALVENPGPGYLRIGKAGEPIVHQTMPQFFIGKAIQVRQGIDLTLISTGVLLRNVVSAAAALEAHGISARVLSVPTLKPFDTEAVVQAARETRRIICVEEHRAPGVLASLVASAIAKHALACPVVGLNLGEDIMQEAFSQESYWERSGLGVTAISKRAIELCELYR